MIRAVNTLATAAILLAQPSWADGFHVTDLRDVSLEDVEFLGGTYASETTASAITFTCQDCNEASLMGIAVAAVADLEPDFNLENTIAACTEAAPLCVASRLEIGDADGLQFITPFDSGVFSHQIILIKDSDAIMVQAIATSRSTARQNADIALTSIVPQIIGPTR